ncbi:dihydroorotase [Anaerotignum lactatifermentans]|uniref:Dihydroorotase n=2 Tax=Anaerotignum lactatifermentans TaxID=160404 RepID=A0ABS2G7R5_9FIRM|nr:dihydroorotase [Anaerotignum lactatifermentans]MBM6877516.1 dihydroorotase [Anaerotignum lactatifermentans]MBM6950822.1 dihydroorotase [Anaerotignum lactatifermentans]
MVFTQGEFVKTNVFVNNGMISHISTAAPEGSSVVFDLEGCVIFPGFIDVHTHLREPGFFYKETIETGTKAAAHGGYTSICAMPNLKPVPDSAQTLAPQLEAIEKTACIQVLPYGAITKGELGQELADFDALAPHVCAFSDDGRGVQNDDMMRQAMTKIHALGKMVAAHCEVNELLRGGYIHDGQYAALHGHKGICSESEWKQIERDLALVRETGCDYHVCHISTKESVELIRQAKKEGLPVSCETGPHYLVLTDMDLQEDGRFKMNPPLRSKEDQAALLEGIQDGTIDMIATDHAPHSAEEKSKGLAGSMMGIVGLETAFPILYTELVKKGVLTLEQLIHLMHTNPSRRFGIGSPLAEGMPADLTVYNLNESYTIDPETFLSKGRSTPFAGWNVWGKCKMTMYHGNIVWQEDKA